MSALALQSAPVSTANTVFLISILTDLAGGSMAVSMGHGHRKRGLITCVGYIEYEYKINDFFPAVAFNITLNSS